MRRHIPLLFLTWVLAFLAGCAPEGSDGASRVRRSLDQAGVLRGTLFTAGSPLAGARVDAFGAEDGQIRATSITDASGRYTLEAAAGQYELRATPPRRAGLRSVSLEDVTIDSAAEDFDIVFAGRPLRVHGIVRGDAGAPMPGAMLSVFDGKTSAWVASMTSAEDGRYEVSLRAGSYSFSISTPSWVVPPRWPNGFGTFKVPARPVKHDTVLDFELPISKIAGKVRDAKGAPVALASLRFSSIFELEPAAQFVSYAETDSRGNYEAFGMAGDAAVTLARPADTLELEHRLSLSAPRSRADFVLPDTRDFVRISGTLSGALPAAGVMLNVSETHGAVNATATLSDDGRYAVDVPRGRYRLRFDSSWDAALDFQYQTVERDVTANTEWDVELATADVSGRVLGVDGAALSGIRVLGWTSGGPGTQDRSSSMGDAITDADGHYSFTLLAGGEGRLSVDYTASSGNDDFYAPLWGAVQHDFNLPRLRRELGQVRGYAGLGVGGVGIEPKSESGFRPVTYSDPDGFYELAISPTDHALAVSGPGENAPNEGIYYVREVGFDEHPQADVDLPVVRVQSRFVNANGSPLDAIGVHLDTNFTAATAPYWNGSSSAASDQAGNASLFALAGTGSVLVGATGVDQASLSLSGIEVKGDKHIAFVFEDSAGSEQPDPRGRARPTPP